MKLLPFKASEKITLGMELEFQIIDPMTYELISRAKDLIRNISASPYQKLIKPEMTQSMIEINSSIHHTPEEIYTEFLAMQSFLLNEAKKIGIYFSGGGAHPFQKWIIEKIFPMTRFKNLSHQYRYLSKYSTIFGQHVHVGCPSGEDALYLTHALARYVPQLIALSASSPFFQGVDTGFHSSRSNVFSAFPLSGVIPYLKNWQEFSDYFYKMRKLKIVKTMKDFYWDIRPKPEFGTVEIRVCDCPLNIEKACAIAAYVQSLAAYLLQEKPLELKHDLYNLYSYNRFQACRYGFDGLFIDPYTSERCTIGEDILKTMQLIEKYIKKLNNTAFIAELNKDVLQKQDDATILRQILKEVGSLPDMMRMQCKIWERPRA